MASFHERMRELRKLRNLTQQEVAEELHLDKQTISQYELGKRQPDFEKLERIADFYNVEVDYLLGRSDVTPRLLSSEDLEKLNQAESKRIPVLGSVVAGIPTEAISDPDEDIFLSADREGEYGALRITGDSMTPDLKDGDLVIFRKQEDANSGDLVIAIIDGTETTVKKLVKEKTKITLQPFNPHYDPLTFDRKKSAKRLQILGKVVESRRIYK